jgi:hypothetical protein
MNDAVSLSAAARRFGLVSPPPASLDVRPRARSVSHDDRKKDTEKKKLEKDRKTTDILANAIDLRHILPTFQRRS